MNVVISQPRYLPALNYLQRLYSADTFVILDSVQRQARGWENRNKVIANGQERWLTIPISSSTRARIDQTYISGATWLFEHEELITQAYSKAPYFDRALVKLYYNGVAKSLENNDIGFRQIILKLLYNCCEIFDFAPNIKISSELTNLDTEVGVEKLSKICNVLNATTYISGPNGKQYDIENAFAESKINVKYHIFEHPIYKQMNRDGFSPYMCFFDVLFSIGLDATKDLISTPWVLRDA
jgi:hypothetical protein